MLHVVIEFFYDHFSVPIHENISSRFFFKENLAKKREEFLPLRSKITLANEKERIKRKSKEEERRRRERKAMVALLSLYIGYFGLTEEVYLAERFQESARFRQVVISLLKKLTKSKGGSRKITSRYFGSNIP